MQLINFLLFILVNVLVVFGQVMMKYGMNKIGNFSSVPFGNFLVQIFTSPFIIIGIGFYAISTIVWLMILSRVSLSIAYPVLSLGYVFILLASALFLKETLNIYHVIGVISIIFGIYLIYVIGQTVAL